MKELVEEMRQFAYRLHESSKTPGGKPSYTAIACNARATAYQIDEWVRTLDMKGLEFAYKVDDLVRLLKKEAQINGS